MASALRARLARAGRTAMQYAEDADRPFLRLQLRRARHVYGAALEAGRMKRDPGYPIPLEELGRTLEQLGVRSGDLLHVQSAVGHLFHGWPEKTKDHELGLLGYAQGVVNLLFDVVGPQGTIVMNTDGITHSDVRRAWAGKVPPGEAVFDYAKTPSRRGLIAELFRRRPETVRSVHPWYNMSAAGPRAEELIGESVLSTPYAMDAHSSTYKLTMGGGKVVMLGPGMTVNSPQHLVEYLHPDEFPRAVYLNRPVAIPFVDRDREVRTIDVLLHAEEWYVSAGAGRNFCLYMNEKHGYFSVRTFANEAEIVLYDARAQYDAVYREMQAGVTLYDPQFE
jgi:aminoglycoside N3'-acetyltransferase